MCRNCKNEKDNSMRTLDYPQRELIFDYSLGLTTEKESVEAKELIASNERATKLHSKLKIALSPLKMLGYVACPDYLAERTILRLKSLANGKQ